MIYDIQGGETALTVPPDKSMTYLRSRSAATKNPYLEHLQPASTSHHLQIGATHCMSVCVCVCVCVFVDKL